MRRQLLATAIAVSLPLAACGDNTEEPTVVDTTTSEATTMPPAAGTTGMAAMPQDFVNQVAASDMYEIQAAELAQQQASSQDVKDFAQQMITDHTASTEKLRAAAAQAPTPLTVNPQLTPELQSNLDALRDAGDNFDQVYMQQQVAAHEKALTLLRAQAQAPAQAQAETAEGDALRTFASQTAEVVQGHLDKARELAATTSSGATGST